MSERFIDTNRERRQSDEPSDESPSELREIRRAGEAFLAAGDDAIARALSGNSQRFLTQHRQQGGQ